MIKIPKTTFIMGNTRKPNKGNTLRYFQDEYPAHEVTVDAFLIDEYPVTNEQFSKFVEETNYITFAERKPTSEELTKYSKVKYEIDNTLLTPGSLCFDSNFTKDVREIYQKAQNWEYNVWKIIPNANWKQPMGLGSIIHDKMDHPVVHVNWEDAKAYCEWAGKRLPTEAEFECAIRGGLESAEYSWGNEIIDERKCNYWVGEFPFKKLNSKFSSTSPVKSYQSNGYGLFDMAGNVWEWCFDWYHYNYYSLNEKYNPQGPKESFDPTEPNQSKKVKRGGSFICNTNNCTGFRCSARSKSDPMTSSFHTGFRCAKSIL